MVILVLVVKMMISAQVPTEVNLTANANGRLIVGLGKTIILDDVLNSRVKDEYETQLKIDLKRSGVFLLSNKAETEFSNKAALRDQGIDWMMEASLSFRNEKILVQINIYDSSSQKTIHSKDYQVGLLGLRNQVHIIVDDMVFWLTGEKGNAWSKIIFARQIRPGIKEIFQMDSDGENISQVTRFNSLTLAPDLSFDGRLVFVTYKNGNPEIWGQKTPKSDFQRLFPLDGKTIDGFYSSPRWSPSGDRISFVTGDKQGRSDIATLDLKTNRLRKLTFNEGINTEPAWSPNGNQIVFTSNRSGGPQLFIMEEDGTNVRQLTLEGSYNASPAWSPKGDMISFVSRFEGKFDLFVYKISEGRSYQITTNLTSSESPAWAPDGRHLVFISARSSGGLIYRTDLTGQDLAIVSELGFCQSPKWVPKE